MPRKFLLTLLAAAWLVTPAGAAGLTPPAAPKLPAEGRTGNLTWPLGPLPAPAAGTLDGPADQPPCPRPTTPLDQVLYDHLRGEGAALSCGNAFETLLMFPGLTQGGQTVSGYAGLTERILSARREVLLANMVWDAGEDTPGDEVAAALARKRQEVLAHPEAYPQGFTVRLMLGNSVRPDQPLDAQANLRYMVQDLLQAGLPLHGQPEGQWRLDIASFRYAIPHSHLKLAVFDGQEVVAGGFNVSTLHLPAAQGGRGLSDLGLTVRGPVARHAAAAFRDSWQLSRPLTCSGAYRRTTGPAGEERRRPICVLGERTQDYPADETPAVPAGDGRTYGLYRRSGYQPSDEALTALLGQAQTQVDLLQAQASGDLACDLSLGRRGECPLERHGLPVWRALISAVQQRGVTIRLVLDRTYPMAAENVSLVRSLQDELARLGKREHLQVRWASHPMHTKLIVVDGQMAVVGSTNLHFSSFGPGGLSEYALASSEPPAIQAAQSVFEQEWAAARPFEYPWWAGK